MNKILLLVFGLGLATLNAFAQLPAPAITICEVRPHPLVGLLAWVEWSDNSTNETAFRVERSEIKGSKWTAFSTVAVIAGSDGTTGLFTDSAGRFDSKTYKYRVRAENAVEVSAWSPEVVCTPL